MRVHPLRAWVATTVLAASACGGRVPPSTQPASVEDLRSTGHGRGKNADPELLGRWALAEMYEPGGKAASAKEARGALGDGEHPGLLANLSRAVYDEEHGEPTTAAAFYAATLKAAQANVGRDALTPLAAWLAARQLSGLRASVPQLFQRHRLTVEALLERPGALGWRAVSELEDLRDRELYDRAEAVGDAYDRLVATKTGCSRALRLAGPFGRGTPADRRRSFPAERTGPWPPVWPAEPTRGTAPHILTTEQSRCLASSTERTENGVYYAETFFTTRGEREILVSVQGAVKVWIDDSVVLDRDAREWGSWHRFGMVVKVGDGRHRVLARTLGDGATVRVLNPDGTAAGVEFDADASRPYGLAPPVVVADPNVLAPLVALAVRGSGATRSALEAALGAHMAREEGLNDVAATLLEPHVSTPGAAAPPGQLLALAAAAAHGDPALAEEVMHRTERELRQRAAAADPDLWYSRAWLILDDADQRGLLEAVEPLRKLVAQFPKVPQLAEQLAAVYAKLGWRAERTQTLAEVASRFPENEGALRTYLEALEEDGTLTEADGVAARIQKLAPDAEIELDRALARHDWKAAVAELRRIEKRRPERKDIAARIADVLERSGDPRAAVAQLERALAKNADDAQARFRIADRTYAAGDGAALRKALADALQAGAKISELREAIDLIEGATDLEPYRIDGRAVIREFEAWEHGGHHMEGTAARVLDYAATWVHPDGSSEMLEHEILRIQSQEAVQKEAEQQPPTGLVLRLRVIKPDGSAEEPEFVSGKPTLTMPHLEVGDYLEIEHISTTPGDGQKGKRFRGPHWFFREADKGYWRSEFIVLTPKDRKVEIEARGDVGKVRVRDRGPFTERRWRVDQSPPAPEEPEAPPITEFLPSVRLGWGITMPDLLARVVDAVGDDTPLDPRLRRKALEIVQGTREGAHDERARRLYRWVADNVQDGRENDGRRVVTGRAGSREAAFQHLVRQLGIPLELVLVKDRLAIPPLGPMSEVENWDSVVLRLATERGPRWLTVRDKFAPYGYVPAELRGQPAIRLVPGTPGDVTGGGADGGASDGVTFEGRATVRDDGSASVDLVQKYAGKLGISMRGVFDRVAEAQRPDFIETRLLARNVPGARLRTFTLENKDDLDAPLVLRIHAEVPQLLRPVGGGERAGLVLRSLFPLHLATLASLPQRQTPLLLATSSHVEVHFQVVVPEALRVPASLPSGEVKDGERVVRVADTVHGHAFELHRVVDIPAGRVQPGADYARFSRFAQDADALVEREILVGK